MELYRTGHVPTWHRVLITASKVFEVAPTAFVGVPKTLDRRVNSWFVDGHAMLVKTVIEQFVTILTEAAQYLTQFVGPQRSLGSAGVSTAN